MQKLKIIAIASLLVFSSPAFAHTGHLASGWNAGLAHPFSGLDHWLAMLAVGLWAAQCGDRRIWLLPAAFIATLAAGAIIAMWWQYPLPALETGIALSVLALGLLISLALHMPCPSSLAATAAFGLLHGYAHGLELPDSALPAAYMAGFLVVTTALHLGGIAIGSGMKYQHAALDRIAGGLIAACGLGLLTLT